MDRFETHSHTYYSNIRGLDCINSPYKLVDRAIGLGLSGIAITDHENLCASVKMNQYQKEIKDKNPNFKIALGNEIYLVDERPSNKHYHFILIAKDRVGFNQLRQLSSIAWFNSYHAKGIERVDTLKSDIEEVIGNEKGHLIAQTACLGGELCVKITEMLAEPQRQKELRHEISNFVKWCKEWFGEDFYLEIAPSLYEKQIAVNEVIYRLAKASKTKVVIGTDAHYLTKEDSFAHKVYLKSQQREREVDDFYKYAYLQSEEEITENLAGIQEHYEEFCKNSQEIWSKIEFYDLSHTQQIPNVQVKNYPKKEQQYFNKNDYPVINSMFSSDDKYDRYWVNQCVDKLKEKKLLNDEYLSRLEEEADTKRVVGKALKTNMYKYPVLLQHYIDLIWLCGSSIGVGRGSAGAGLNHYLLEVVSLDPIKHSFPWWRYMDRSTRELGDRQELCLPIQ